MACMPGFEHAARLARENGPLAVGAHLCLTAGSAAGGVYATITDASGGFINRDALREKAESGLLDPDEAEAEFEAQIAKIISAGIRPDHFDSHHHIHRLPGIDRVFLKVAKKYGVAVRRLYDGRPAGDYRGVRSTDGFSAAFYGGTATAGTLKSVISSFDGESLEIMCHPGFADYALYSGSSYSIGRLFEARVLTGDEMKLFIAENGHELCSFSDLI